jgi:hypothetical protein
MNSTNRKNSRSLVTIGLFLLVAANFLRRGLHPTAQISANTLDAIVGFSYGVSIAVLLFGVRRVVRQQSSGTCN